VIGPHTVPELGALLRCCLCRSFESVSTHAVRGAFACLAEQRGGHAEAGPEGRPQSGNTCLEEEVLDPLSSILGPPDDGTFLCVRGTEPSFLVTKAPFTFAVPPTRRLLLCLFPWGICTANDSRMDREGQRTKKKRGQKEGKKKGKKKKKKKELHLVLGFVSDTIERDTRDGCGEIDKAVSI